MGRHRLSVVGVGADGARGLSDAARDLIAQAPILAGSAEHLKWWTGHPGKRLALGSDLGKFLDTLEQALIEDPVVLLASGDPLFFGIGRLVIERFGPEDVEFHPHLSAVQLAFSRAKLPWQEAVLVSAHGRSLSKLADALRSHPELVAVLSDPLNTPAVMARFVLDLGLVSPYRLWVCARLGSEVESVECLSCEEAMGRTFDAPNVVILERQPARSPDELPAFGIPDDCFVTYSDRPGLMTKFEVRVLALAYLQLALGQVVWDIGSGTGSVAIEAARLVGTGTVYAVEKTEAGCGLIERNTLRLGVTNVKIVRARAPEGLVALPDPDRVFIGGGGDKLLEILDCCGRVLKPGGQLVANFASLEPLVTAQAHLQKLGWSVQYSQLLVSRSATIAAATRLVPLNPVFLLRASKS